MPDHVDIPEAILRHVRLACAHLPEASEEQAFAGVRWRIRGRTLVHVTTRVLEQGPITVMTFHCIGEERDALLGVGDPFHPGWGDGLIAMVLRNDGTTDWQEVKELLTESYRLLAPKKLVARLDDAPPAGGASDEL